MYTIWRRFLYDAMYIITERFLDDGISGLEFVFLPRGDKMLNLRRQNW